MMWHMLDPSMNMGVFRLRLLFIASSNAALSAMDAIVRCSSGKCKYHLSNASTYQRRKSDG